MGSYIVNEKGTLHFQAEGYPQLPRDYVALNITDRRAWLPLYCYAQLVGEAAPEFSEDLADVVCLKGFRPKARHNLLFRAVYAHEEATIEKHSDVEEGVRKRVDEMSPGELHLWYRHIVDRMNLLIDD